MKKEIKDLTLEKLAKGAFQKCDRCPLKDFDCLNICSRAFIILRQVETEERSKETNK